MISSGPDIVVYYPIVFNMDDKALEQYINQSIIEETQKLINKQISEMDTPIVSMVGTFEIKNNQRDVLSITLTNYAYHDKAAHGMTYIVSLTFDLEKGKKCELADLFKPGSNYVERTSELIKEQIRVREISLINEFTEISPNQQFYIADKTLVIYFQLYDLTPYVFGFPMFPISVYDLQDIIDEEGPLGRMAQNN
ncbi:hypothetical protein GCM10008025_14520 [Ornithinibacillus halotolerans]|uniref:DUF3298 domain-containing protein n=2 Tax=Ornithinibacillus halotolerans TaxID=1274357 RepID=A0A916W6Q4_9BACI|nr:hypothetical protein GCM10008025_14520 [Ornithinibacillus halotolerans]